MKYSMEQQLSIANLVINFAKHVEMEILKSIVWLVNQVFSHSQIQIKIQQRWFVAISV